MKKESIKVSISFGVSSYLNYDGDAIILPSSSQSPSEFHHILTKDEGKEALAAWSVSISFGVSSYLNQCRFALCKVKL